MPEKERRAAFLKYNLLHILRVYLKSEPVQKFLGLDKRDTFSLALKNLLHVCSETNYENNNI